MRKPKHRRLSRRFFTRDTKTVAKQLLGKSLCVQTHKGIERYRIIETEAYLGVSDRACHSYNNRRTPRTEAMYRAGGNTYVYFIYGMHYCLNVVSSKINQPEAVLIRALSASTQAIDKKLTGPGKLTAALGIDKKDNQLDLTRSQRLWIESTPRPRGSSILATTRIGVANYGMKAARAKLRFILHWPNSDQLRRNTR